jgi:hypothetical protein
VVGRDRVQPGRRRDFGPGGLDHLPHQVVRRGCRHGTVAARVGAGPGHPR